MFLVYLLAKYFKSQKRKDWYILVGISTIAIWGGNPCCFVAGGYLALEFLRSIKRRDFKWMSTVIVSGVLIITSFVVYYFVWLKPVIDRGFMTAFWGGNKFPIPFVSTKEELISGYYSITNMILWFGYGKYLVCLGAVCGAVLAVRKRNKVLCSLLFTIALAVLASSIGRFPIAIRLWLFIIPITFVFIMYFLDFLLARGKMWINAIVAVLIIFVFWQEQGITVYADSNCTRYEGEQMNELVEYVGENIKEDENLYLYYSGVWTFWYLTGADNHSIGGYEDNVIYSEVLDVGLTPFDIEYISEHPRMYLLMYHNIWTNFDTVAGLCDKGVLHLVKDNYGTPLYYFDDYCHTDKVKAEISIVGDKISVTNVGEWYLGNNFSEMYLSDMNGNLVAELPKSIAPSETVLIDYASKISVDELRLVVVGQYVIE